MGNAAEAASAVVGGVGFQTSVAVHVSAVHEGGSNHKFETDGAFELVLVDDGANRAILYVLHESYDKTVYTGVPLVFSFTFPDKFLKNCFFECVFVHFWESGLLF